MQVPVVAPSVTGCVDAVQDGVTGLLVPPHDPESLARAIHTYLKDPELRRANGSAARKWVLANFRREALWKALYQEYVRCLRDKKCPIPAVGAIEGRQGPSRSGLGVLSTGSGT